ncbi:unnamed protein product [Trichobilharzia regenti]|nr:unnamed protein product [Trichobilharzia regenti]
MGYRFWPNLGFGYNAGLLLIDLAKLRKRQWDKLWMKVAFYLMKQKGSLPTAEQVSQKDHEGYRSFDQVVDLQRNTFRVRSLRYLLQSGIMNGFDR